MALGPTASAGTATLYYYTPSKAWSAAYVHHNASGSWTSPPGLALSAACTDWVTGTLTTGSASTFQAVFTDGQNRWDNPNNQSGTNYNLPTSGIPALQKGQYSTEGVQGGMAFKRRFTDASKGVDSFVLVTVSGGATFSGIPNGTYKDAVTGDVKTVTSGVLTASVSGKGNLLVYVLDLSGNPAPGKVGVDGPYLKP